MRAHRGQRRTGDDLLRRRRTDPARARRHGVGEPAGGERPLRHPRRRPASRARRRDQDQPGRQARKGGRLAGAKVTTTVSKARNIPVGTDALSPDPKHDIYSIEDMPAEVWLWLLYHNHCGIKITGSNYTRYVAAGMWSNFVVDYLLVDSGHRRFRQLPRRFLARRLARHLPHHPSHAPRAGAGEGRPRRLGRARADPRPQRRTVRRRRRHAAVRLGRTARRGRHDQGADRGRRRARTRRASARRWRSAATSAATAISTARAAASPPSPS